LSFGGFPDLPNPPSKDQLVVILFVGGLLPERVGTSVVGTGMYEIARQLRSIGIRAEVYASDQRENAGTEVANLPEARFAPIAIVGYTFGAVGTTRLARLPKDRGIPVETLVAIEAWRRCRSPAT